MKSLSLDSNSFLSPLLAPSRAFPQRRLSPARPGHFPRQPQTVRRGKSSWFSPVDDRVSGGISVGLIALTLPAVGYAFYQLWQLVGGETLNQAVRAFVP